MPAGRRPSPRDVRPALVLAGAGVAAILLTSAAVVRVATDPEIRDCAAALAAMNTANRTHQDALEVLDRATIRARRDGAEQAGVGAATATVKQVKRDLDAARDEFALLCHYPEPTP